MTDLPIIREGLQAAGLIYIGALKQELSRQKHVASGELRDGFFARVHQTNQGIKLDIMNNVPYMWTVNDGNPSGVNASYDEIKAWAETKGFTFKNRSHQHFVINKIKNELMRRYLTRGGDRIAPDRYFFIDIAFENASPQAEKSINNHISKEIDDILSIVGDGSKAIEITL